MNKLANWINSQLIKSQKQGFNAVSSSGNVERYMVSAINARMNGLGMLNPVLGELTAARIEIKNKNVYIHFTHSNPTVKVATINLSA